MLVRLYGAEEEARTLYAAGEISHPFEDGNTWAAPYLAWLYSRGLVKGMSDTRYGADASVKNAILADGCDIQGAVEDSVLFRGVTVGRGSTVKNSIIMQGVTIGDGCSLDHVVLDKGVTIRDGRTLIGYDSFPIILKKNTTV